LVSNKKIVSFLPSATEILYEIGSGSQIIGVTHECNYPEEAKSKPKIINSSFDASTMTSKEIDDKIVELFGKGQNIYIINDGILKELKPDIIIAQGICEVCSPFTKEINRAISILEYTTMGRTEVSRDSHGLASFLLRHPVLGRYFRGLCS
jgi:iron complex transport system substrate-binding protein